MKAIYKGYFNDFTIECEAKSEEEAQKILIEQLIKELESGEREFIVWYEREIPLIILVQEAMERTKNWNTAWWLGKEINDIINEGVNMGWLLRPSTTQVEWTEKGMEAIKTCINPLENMR